MDTALRKGDMNASTQTNISRVDIDTIPLKSLRRESGNQKFGILEDCTTIPKGKELHRIVALRNTLRDGTVVAKGAVGGFVEKTSNLSSNGGARIQDDAKAMRDSFVGRNEILSGDRTVKGKEIVPTTEEKHRKRLKIRQRVMVQRIMDSSFVELARIALLINLILITLPIIGTGVFFAEELFITQTQTSTPRGDIEAEIAIIVNMVSFVIVLFSDLRHPPVNRSGLGLHRSDWDASRSSQQTTMGGASDHYGYMGGPSSNLQMAYDRGMGIPNHYDTHNPHNR